MACLSASLRLPLTATCNCPLEKIAAVADELPSACVWAVPKAAPCARMRMVTWAPSAIWILSVSLSRTTASSETLVVTPLPGVLPMMLLTALLRSLPMPDDELPALEELLLDAGVPLPQG